jgi:hypothetical protein
MDGLELVGVWKPEPSVAGYVSESDPNLTQFSTLYESEDS